MAFAIINHIDDMLPYIKDKSEIIVAERDGYKIINYTVAFEDTFGEPNTPERLYLQEARGIVFDQAGGLIARRLNKFWNLGEKPETAFDKLPWDKPYVIMDKLDGSMIAVFVLDGELIWGTKMVAQEFHDEVKQFVGESEIDYETFCWELINKGYTPIFEWTSPNNRIVVEYTEPKLILIAVRDMTTGEYIQK